MSWARNAAKPLVSAAALSLSSRGSHTPRGAMLISEQNLTWSDQERRVLGVNSIDINFGPKTGPRFFILIELTPRSLNMWVNEERYFVSLRHIWPKEGLFIITHIQWLVLYLVHWGRRLDFEHKLNCVFLGIWAPLPPSQALSLSPLTKVLQHRFLHFRICLQAKSWRDTFHVLFNGATDTVPHQVHKSRTFPPSLYGDI